MIVIGARCSRPDDPMNLVPPDPMNLYALGVVVSGSQPPDVTETARACSYYSIRGNRSDIVYILAGCAVLVVPVYCSRYCSSVESVGS